MRPERSLVICTLPRSGSYMLCDGLTQTEKLGYAAEYYSAAHRLFYERLVGKDKAQNYDIVFDYIMRMGTTPNGVFAVKVLFHQLVTLRENFDRCSFYPDIAPLQLLDRLLPNPCYLHLIRRDKLRQAISYHRAISSGVWWRFDASQTRAEATRPEFNQRAIAHWLHTMTVWEKGWAEMLRHVRGPVLTLYYDDVVADYAGAMRKVHELVGIPPDPGIDAIRPALRKQSDGTTEDWVRRFNEIGTARSLNEISAVRRGPMAALAPA
jgi:trehalose 2-sulfotransferase